MMVEQLKKSKRKKQLNTEKLAVKSRSRMEGWIQGTTNNQKTITDGHTMTMLNGLYRSQNPQNHNFRQPAGKLTTISYYADSYDRNMSIDNKLSYSSQILDHSQSRIIKPLDFTTLKGHVPERQRVAQSQQRYQKEFIVTRGNNWASNPDRTPDKSVRGLDFRTSFKKYDDCSRINQSLRQNPILTVGSSSLSVKEQSGSQSVKDLKLKMQRKVLEKNWRKEAINTKAFSSWAQIKMTNPSADPFIEDKQGLVLKNRLHHKELDNDLIIPDQSNRSKTKRQSRTTIMARKVKPLELKYQPSYRAYEASQFMNEMHPRSQTELRHLSAQSSHNSIAELKTTTLAGLEADSPTKRVLQYLNRQPTLQTQPSLHKTAMTDRAMGAKVYMKSIESQVPYNKIALNNRKIEQYLNLNKQTVVLDGSRSAKQLSKITQGAMSFENPRNLDIEQAGSALKEVEDKLNKITESKGLKIEEIDRKDIIAEESGSLGDSKEKRGFKQVKLQGRHSQLSRHRKPTLLRDKRQGSRESEVQRQASREMLSTPGFNNQQTYPSHDTSLQAVSRREIPTYTKAFEYLFQQRERLTSCRLKITTL